MNAKKADAINEGRKQTKFKLNALQFFFAIIFLFILIEPTSQ